MGKHNTDAGKATASFALLYDNLSAKSGFLILLAIALVMGLIIYHKFIFGAFDFIYIDIGSDTLQLYFPEYYRIVSMIESGHWSWWDFSHGVGANTMATSQYFADPFTLFYIIGGTENLAGMLAIVMLIKHLTAAGLFFLFIGRLGTSVSSRIIASIIYAFSGYMISWGQHYVFASFIALFPVLLWALEKYLAERKLIYIPLAVLLLSHNIYLLFPGLLFFIAYAIVRMRALGQGNILRRAVIISGLSLLGLTLAAAWTLPKIYVMLSSPRLQVEGAEGGSPLMLFDSMKYYVHSMFRFLSNNLTGVGSGLDPGFMYNESELTTHSYSNFYEFPALFSGLLVLILLPMGWHSLSKRERKAYSPLLIIMGLALLLPVFSLIFNLMTSVMYRWTFIIITYLLALLPMLLDRIGLQKLTARRKLYGLAPAGIFALGLLISLTIDNVGYHNIFIAAIPIAIFLLAYMLILLKGGTWDKAKWILLGIVIVEMTLQSYPVVNYRQVLNSEVKEGKTDYCDDTYKTVRKLKMNDPGWWRIYREDISVYYNDALVQGYNGFNAYSSLPNPYYWKYVNSFISDKDIALLGRMHVQTGLPYRKRLPQPLSLLGAKYYISDGKPLPLGFRPLSGYNTNVAINDYALPIAFSYDKYINADDFNQMGMRDRHRAILKAVISEPDFESGQLSPLNMTQFAAPARLNLKGIRPLNAVLNKNALPDMAILTPINPVSAIIIPLETGKLKSDAISFVLKTVITVTKPGAVQCLWGDGSIETVAGTEKLSIGKNMIEFSGTLSPGAHYLKIAIQNTGQYSIAKLICRMDDFSEYIDDIAELKQYPVAISSLSPDHIEGAFNFPTARFLMFSIPYCRGWEISVDGGEPASPEQTGLGLMGKTIAAGRHSFVLSFSPPLFNAGKVVTVLSIIFYMLLLTFRNKKSL